MGRPFSTTKRWVCLCSSCSSAEIEGEYKKDKKGRQLYVPRALCVLSHQPYFTAFNVFLRELYRNAILDSEDQFADENDSIPRVESFEALLRKGFSFCLSCFVGSLCDTLFDDSMTLLPRTSHFSQSPIAEKHIQHFIDFCPALDPGFLIHVDASLFCILIHSSPYSRRSARFEFRLWRASPTPTSCVSSVFSLLCLPKTSWKSTQRSSRSSASSSCPSRWTP